MASTGGYVFGALVVTVVATAAWLTGLLNAGSPGAAQWISAVGTWWVPSLAIAFTAIQFLNWGEAGALIRGFWSFILLFVLAHVVAGDDGVASLPISHLAFVTKVDLWSIVIVLIVNCFVPEFISRWRGSNLLYPTAFQMACQRASIVLLLVGCCWSLGFVLA
jgi:hypothetical protein